VTRKTVNSKTTKASDKAQRKAIVNPYNSKADKKTIRFGGEEIRLFDKTNEELNFTQLDSLQLDNYDSAESPQTTPNESSFGKEDQDPTSRLTTMNISRINAHEGNGNNKLWFKTANKDQDLLGILSPSGSEDSDTMDSRSIAVDVGGGGNCAYCAVSDQALGSPGYHLALRAATANELTQNSDIYEQNHMIIDDNQGTVTVEEYAARVARPGEYAGHVELQAMARLLNHSIKVFDRDGDPNKTRIIEAFENDIRNFADEYYELVHDSKSQHYLSLHSNKFRDRRARLSSSSENQGL
jgi:hypothetical protein